MTQESPLFEESTQIQTQPTSQGLTQERFDSRRRGRNNSGLSGNDASDVFCILHPASIAACRVVAHTARTKPQHVLQESNQELALRFSSNVVDLTLGFCFGRHPLMCDIILDAENIQKRVSNKHFRIYINDDGIMMLEDLSSNGTIVDNMTIGGSKRKEKNPRTHMLASGAVIEILSDAPGEVIKFVAKIPHRLGSERAYTENFQRYMEYQAVIMRRKKLGMPMPAGNTREVMASQEFSPSVPRSTLNPPGAYDNYGMLWSGGGEYTCIGIVGKGAFATVYQIATRLNGELFAAKELEKKRFIKNGVLDERLSNELRIMKRIRHPHIVDYINYVETDTHLYIIMEYVRYGDLSGYMQPDGSGEVRTLSEKLAQTVARQILLALAYLHDLNVTHRDIKPDNILISSEDPFTVKLTDFGLSKMTKDTDTFLKTFCGTLLYCAPEVFPFYESVVPPKRTKRPRVGQSQRRSYSQLVDIWSFAAVLWYTLCGYPPFEGITDGNGRAMFNRIMGTDLDTTPLEKKGVSAECVDLLLEMLCTDPSLRPSEQDCLSHPWLNAGHTEDGPPADGLGAIAEGDEDLDCSQLTIEERPDSAVAGASESFDSTEFAALRGYKRQKGKDSYYIGMRTQPIEVPNSHLPSELNSMQSEDPTWSDDERHWEDMRAPSVLRSSGVFGQHMSLETHRPQESENDIDMSIAQADSPSELENHTTVQFKSPALRGHQPNRLESMVRQLKMVSPDTSSSLVALKETPSTPKTTQAAPGNGSSQNRHTLPGDTNLTPKQQTFSRKITLPPAPSFYYDPRDPSTHNLEYASRVSGLNFLEDVPTENNPNKENEHDDSALSPPMSIPSFPAPARTTEFIKPPTILGKLTSTPNSFINLTLNLTSRITTWGRHSKNTLVYRNDQDTRVSKVALELYFHAPGIEGVDAAGGDWSGMEGLCVLVSTQSQAGIWVNGTMLPAKDGGGRTCFGRLFTGDEVCVSSPEQGKGLRFKCEFFVGKGIRRRREGNGFVVEVEGGGKMGKTGDL